MPRDGPPSSAGDPSRRASEHAGQRASQHPGEQAAQHAGETRAGLTRRDLFRRAGAAAIVSAALSPAAAALAKDPDTDADVRVLGPGRVPLRLLVNGVERDLRVEPRETLLDVLRGPLDLTGAKRVCDRGACGACTIHLDGAPVPSCTVLALDAEGRRVTTIEGLGAPTLVAAFAAADAMQCGFCTPGMVMSCAAALAAHGPSLTLEQARAATAGNLCRCGTYPHVLEAALAAARGKR